MPDSDEVHFLALRDEWQALLNTANQDNGVAWETSFIRINEEYDSLRSQGKWLSGPTDLLSVIHCSRKEVIHSALIAWLLDPSGKHGLGSIFLRQLLTRFFPNEECSNLHAAIPRCEVYCDAGRADIVVEGLDFTLVIENKVDSWERDRQCDDYFHAFQDCPRPLFVFLTPDGRSPSTATGRAKEAFRCLGYRDLRLDLARALEDAALLPHPAGRAVAENYLLTLTKEFP